MRGVGGRRTSLLSRGYFRTQQQLCASAEYWGGIPWVGLSVGQFRGCGELRNEGEGGRRLEKSLKGSGREEKGWLILFLVDACLLDCCVIGSAVAVGWQGEGDGNRKGTRRFGGYRREGKYRKYVGGGWRFWFDYLLSRWNFRYGVNLFLGVSIYVYGFTFGKKYYKYW